MKLITYLKKTSKITQMMKTTILISIILSTTALALPQVPNEIWQNYDFKPITPSPHFVGGTDLKADLVVNDNATKIDENSEIFTPRSMQDDQDDQPPVEDPHDGLEILHKDDDIESLEVVDDEAEGLFLGRENVTEMGTVLPEEEIMPGNTNGITGEQDVAEKPDYVELNQEGLSTDEYTLEQDQPQDNGNGALDQESDDDDYSVPEEGILLLLLN